MPELHLLAGPNGSGKSTFAREVQSGARTIGYEIPPVINPDVIAAEMNPDDPDAAAALGAREALRRRSAALAAGESFAIETTLSGRSEVRLVDDARAAGYTVSMTYVALNNVDANVDRVNIRALEEIRTVPAEDVRRRYGRSLAAAADIAERIDAMHVWDNSDSTFAFVARLERGKITSLADDVPAWAERTFAAPLALARGE